MINALRDFLATEPGRFSRQAVLAAALLFPATTAAQEPVPDRSGVPILFGHAFVLPALIRTPFVRTNVSNTVAIGQALDVEFGEVVLPSGDTLAALNGDLTFARLAFAYEHALRDWLSVWGRLEVNARLGTDVGSLLSAGVTLATGFELGWLAQMRETERSLLSASVFVRNSSHTLVDLGRWADQLVNGNTANLVVTSPTLRAGAGLSYAWVLNDLIGFIFEGDATYGEELRREENQFFFSGTAAMSLNLDTRTSVPLGMAVTFRADSHPSVHGEQTSGWEAAGLRFSYTGRQDLRLSLTAEGQLVPYRGDQTVTVGLISFDIQYFF